jgi:hypothetical protein
MKLYDLFKIKARFHRSVQIELDSALDDYVVTQSGLKILKRIDGAIDSKHGTRAWTITGPYGSGKSAFIVFLKSLFGDGTAIEVSNARELLRKADKNLYKKLFESSQIFTKTRKRFCTSLVSAGRERIEHAILKGLLFGLNNFYKNSRSPQPIIKEIEKALKKCEQGNIPSSDLIITLCESATQSVIKSNGAGLLLVIDELGKCLETAVLNQHNDIFVLQKLAETASRSDKHPFLLFTVLHQSFERYAARLDSDKRNEWSKIQGRFEDVSFVDSSDQVYKLIASAIVQPSQKTKRTQVVKSTKNVFGTFDLLVKDNPLFVSKSSKQIMRWCLPLHPLTTMALVPLFRSKFAQNERSLFAFLTSTEPGSFSDFLFRTEITKHGEELPLYTLHHLYDYLISNFGVNLFAHSNGKKWVEIDQALSRSADELELQVIKTIGVLNLLGENFGIPVSEEAIQCAIGLNSKDISTPISKVLKILCKKSVVVYRRYSSSYVLWGGSDIDIEQKIHEVKQDKITGGDLVEMLNKLFPLRPKVAKRYLYKIGTLRYFKMRYVDVMNLAFELENEIADADGQILLVINCKNADLLKVDSVQKIFRDSGSKEKQKTIIGVLPNAERVLNVFTELLALQWIKKNTPELQGDQIAMREVEARILQMERMVNEATNELFYGDNSESDLKTYWIDSGLTEPRINITRRELSRMVSNTCDRVYDKTPVIKNELINRAFLSVNVVGARRLLLHAILEKSNEERLGIEGFPPEYSIYYSVLKNSKLHQLKDKEEYGFVAEPRILEESWRPLWENIVQFLEKNDDRKVPVTELMDLMQKPPYGIKAGVIPIILSVIIKAYDTEIALFELGTFRPVIKSTDFDLLTKVPHKFALQLCRITGVKAEVFDQITKTIVKGKGIGESKKYSLMQIVKMLCQFTNNLPSYVKTTATLSEKAKAVRNCLLESKEPATLLYRDLPKACGLKPITDHNKTNENVAKDFVKLLKDALIELQRKESDLLGWIENILLHTFSLPETHSDYRSSIVERANCVLPVVAFDPEVKSFLVRVVDDLVHKAWLDSIGTVITKRPPLSWTDDDLLKFEQEMIAMSSKIAKYERLALAKGYIHDELIQISITSNKKGESFKIIHQTQSEKKQVEQVKEQLSAVFKNLDPNENIDLILRSLSEYAVKLIKDHKAVKQEKN